MAKKTKKPEPWNIPGKRHAVSVDDKTPCCEQGDDCDPNENPGHHVEVHVEKWVLKAIRAAIRRAEFTAAIDNEDGARVLRDLREAHAALRRTR